MKRDDMPTVVFAFPRWEVSGVTSVNLDLAAALRDMGVRCVFVVEEDNRETCPFDLPDGIPIHRLAGKGRGWAWIPSRSIAYRLRMQMEWKKLRRILAGEAPVALIPGYAHALAAPGKPWGGEIGVFGVVHADDETNVRFAVHDGKRWARCICVSGRVADRVRAAAPWLEPSLCVIPNGVPCSTTPPAPREKRDGRLLRIVYAGRLEQPQKRVHDLAQLVDLASGKRLPIEWHIAGEGPEEAALRERLRPHIESGAVRWHGALKRNDLRVLFGKSDIVILLSAYEGLPICLLEGMAEGCVPVVSEGCDAGADLVRAAGAGFVLPTGDLHQYVAALEKLSASPEQLGELGRLAWAAIASGPHNAAAMGAAYCRLISEWHPASKPVRSSAPTL
jgi:glycosyltransferase involved in cell wall biosynthesis